MKASLKVVRPLAVMATVAVVVGACDEQLNGGIACPVLCPGQQVAMRETTFFAVELDTSIVGFPAIGGEQQFFIATLGDTLETAAAVRYDSLPKFWRRANSPDDSAIVFIDTGAHVRLSIVTGDTLAAPTTVEVYDIDLAGEEEADPALVAAAFTPDRLLGSRTIPADSLRDSVRVPIDPAVLLAKIAAAAGGLDNRLRIGIRVAQAGNPRLSVVTSNAFNAPLLVFRPSPDTSVPPIRVEPLSRTPDEPFIAADLADYLVVRKAPPDPPLDVFRVGGLPARRAYLLFNIPSNILDSSNVVSATLYLTQRPSLFSPEPTDTISLGHFGVVAGATITDLSRALIFLQRLANTDTISVVAADSGVRTFEMIDWVRTWRGTKPDKTPRALALATTQEGEIPRHVDFFSIESEQPEVRPRLRLTYLPRPEGPLP